MTLVSVLETYGDRYFIFRRERRREKKKKKKRERSGLAEER